MHQKQPPPKVASSVLPAVLSGAALRAAGEPVKINPIARVNNRDFKLAFIRSIMRLLWQLLQPRMSASEILLRHDSPPASHLFQFGSNWPAVRHWIAFEFGVRAFEGHAPF